MVLLSTRIKQPLRNELAMKSTKTPLDIDKFLEQNRKDPSLNSFSRESIQVILERIKLFEANNADVDYDWRDFFAEAKEVWAEGLLTIPHDELVIDDADIARLDKIKTLKKEGKRCSDLIYEAAAIIAENNDFVPLKSARFLI